MEIQDGFIVGVFNYCDAWCEACRFTGHCRLFADRVEMEAQADPNLKAIADAPLLPEEEPPPPPQWMQEIFDEMNEASKRAMSDEELKALDPAPKPEHHRIYTRAKTYSERVRHWLKSHADPERTTNDPRNPVDVIEWFALSIPAKVHRAGFSFALAEAEDSEDEDNGPTDYDGSARVALDGIDRSHAAWLSVVDNGLAKEADVHPFIVDLVWLGDAIDREFPNARAFIRPGFDEPDELVKLSL